MRKKILGIIAVTLTASMMAATLTGCGTKVKATDQEIAGEETFIVTDDESSEDATVSMEDEITGTEDIVADTEMSAESSVTEHEYFYRLDKLDPSTKEDIDMSALNPNDEMYTLDQSVTLYGTGTGAAVGYTKPGISIKVISSNDDWKLVCFDDEDDTNKYLLVKTEDVLKVTGAEAEGKVLVTLDDVRQTFMDSLNEIQYQDDTVVNFEMLDSASTDMESVEFKVPMYCGDSDTRQLDRWISQMQVENQLGMYSKFYIEPIADEFDDEYLWFKVYYKDLQESGQ